MDIVDELYESDAANALTNRAAREIERLRAELADHASPEMVLALKATIRHESDCAESYKEEAERLRADLEAAQAREQKMRTALASALSAINYRGKSVPFVEAMTSVSNALQIKRDDSALRERLKAGQERVCEWIKNNYQNHTIESLCDAIRAMEN